MFTDFRETEGWGEEHRCKREWYPSVAPQTCRDQGSNSQPRCVPWPGTLTGSPTRDTVVCETTLRPGRPLDFQLLCKLERCSYLHRQDYKGSTPTPHPPGGHSGWSWSFAASSPASPPRTWRQGRQRCAPSGLRPFTGMHGPIWTFTGRYTGNPHSLSQVREQQTFMKTIKVTAPG